jgi:hypothetical protein
MPARSSGPHSKRDAQRYCHQRLDGHIVGYAIDSAFVLRAAAIDTINCMLSAPPLHELVKACAACVTTAGVR